MLAGRRDAGANCRVSGLGRISQVMMRSR
jgi:hypothetical protein